MDAIKKSLLPIIIILKKKKSDRGRVCPVNSSLIFSGKPIVSEEFLNQVVGALGVIIDRCPKERPRKRES
jgi:hypothetical protein